MCSSDLPRLVMGRDPVGQRRRVVIVLLHQPLSGPVRQEEPVPELAQHHDMRLHIGTKGSGGNEAAPASVALPVVFIPSTVPPI